jgi:hypothetical protein
MSPAPVTMRVEVDLGGFLSAIARIRPNPTVMADLEGDGARLLIQLMKDKVPVDSGDTRDSISSHIQKLSSTEIVNDVGPETSYSSYIEYGITSRPAYPIQPFVRPAAAEHERITNEIGYKVKRWLSWLWR